MRKHALILASVALAIAFGLQDLRAFFPSIVYVVKDRLGVSSVGLGALGIGLFALAGLAPRWVRGFGAVQALPFAIVGVSGLRAALQVWPGDPIGFLVIAGAGVLALFALIAALVARGPLWAAPAFLLGAAIDTSLHAARATEDWHWADGAADAVIVVLAATTALLAARSFDPDEEDEPGPIRSHGVTALFVWGPLLFLHLEWLANVARLSAKTGLRSEAAGAVIVGGEAIAIAAAAALPVSRVLRWIAGAVLIAATAMAARAGTSAIPVQLAAIAAAALLLRDATIPGAQAARMPGLAMGGGAVLLILLAFAHYAGYDLPLPWKRAQVWIAAAVMLGAAAVARNARLDAARSSTRLALVPAALAFVLLLAGSRRVAEVPSAAALPDSPSIVTFNLHAGFDERGDFAFAAMMDSLRAQGADVVALQEVSRGWLINGCADLYELARRRLPMSSAFGASIDTDWGNGVFATAPIKTSSNVPLPPPDLALTRAVLDAEIPWTATPHDSSSTPPSSAPLHVLATHFHHRESDEAIREQHARFLAARFSDPGPAVLLGDFNAKPGAPSLEILERAGWRDVARLETEDAAAPTYPSVAPERRIDTIFVRGLEAAETWVPDAWGSDHRAVGALLQRAAGDFGDPEP